MHRLERCPCCGGDAFTRWPALVAPFIAEYALKKPVTPTELRECRACRFRFFADRFDADEIARLYGGYRGAGYFAVRHRHEPWYTRKVNEGLGAAVEMRRARIHALLAPHVQVAAVDTVLDYGGDAGQMIPLELGRRRFVYELSNVAPVAGVTKLGVESGIYDVVLLSHVLEHHADPLALLERVKALTRGHLYIEVPYERPLMLAGRGRFSSAWLDLLRRRPLALRAADFVSTAARIGAGVVPPLGVPKLHEHLNFFDGESLGRLAERAGLRVLSCERVGRDLRGDEDVIACVAAA